MAAAPWFLDARFGLFVHWGMFSAAGWEPSWPLVGGVPAFPFCQDLPVDTYYGSTDAFDPPAAAADDWLALAKACGMRYAVLTTKHHDGYTLFPTASARRHARRDLVAEFVDATRRAGLRVGLYFSLPDWGHPDYPEFRDEMRPYGFFAYPRPSAEAWTAFMADLHDQLDDLLTRYGPIDLLWFDGGWERTADEWNSLELERFIRERQPDIVINDRLPQVGDYSSPEQSLPLDPIAGPWELCLTMNHSWGPVAADDEYKSARRLVVTLCEAAAAGGNLLLNISPDGDGRLPAPQRERLEIIAGWMARHRPAVFDTGPGLPPGRFYGPSATAGDVVYLFCVMRPQDTVTVRGLRGRRIRSVRALGSDTALAFDLQLSAVDRLLGGDPVCDVVISVPAEACDDLVTVIEVCGGLDR